MFAFMRRKVWRGFAITFGALLLIVAALSIIAIAWLNPRLTRYIESDSFRAEMEKETARASISRADITNQSSAPAPGRPRRRGFMRKMAAKP